MSGTSPCRVLDMSWTCPLSWVFRSNLEYPPSPGYRSGTRRMIQVLICYSTVPGVLEGTWIMSDILGKPCGYGAQLHLKPHPRHGHISPRLLGPSAKLESTQFPGRWGVVQGGWYSRLEYAIPMLCESLMVYMICLIDMVNQRGPSIISNHTPHTLHMFSNLSRFSGPRSGNLQSLLGGGVVQCWWCRCGYAIPMLQESWRVCDSYLTGWNGIACPFLGRCPCITLSPEVGGPWLDVKTGMIARNVWCVTG